MRYLTTILTALALTACSNPTSPAAKPNFSPSGNLQPVCTATQHKRITAVSLQTHKVIAWVCVPN